MKIISNRKQNLFIALALLAIFSVQRFTANAQGTSFGYQGQLNANGGLANGLYDFRFRLALDDQGNAYVGGTYLTNGIVVTNGLFITSVNFGAGIFTGSNYWLEVDVRTNNPANTLAYTVLSPLQAVMPAPYAIMANSASNLLGTIPAGQITGPVASGNLSGTYGNAVTLNNPGNSFTGDGTGLANVNATALNGLNAGSFWQLSGNNVATGQFLGSTNNQPVELDVYGSRVLRLESGGASVASGTNTPTGAPNLIGGVVFNNVAAGTVGSVIVGGGATNWNGIAVHWANSIALGSDFSFVGGGIIVTIQSNSSCSTISGGEENSIGNNSAGSTIDGGIVQNILVNSTGSTLGGGYYDTIGNNAPYTTIGGGYNNSIVGDSGAAGGSVIGGGADNNIFTNTPYSFIGGGAGNSIAGDANNNGGSVIAGGGNNVINNNSDHAFIGGGWYNFMGSNNYEGVIAGGYQNNMFDSAGYSFIGGGENIVISTNTAFSSVVGGYNNVILPNAQYSFIGGGLDNTIYGDSQNFGTSVIVGGDSDTIYPGSFNSFIGGGQGNVIGTNADHSVIVGGNNNVIGNGAFDSFAAGNGAKAANNNSFVWCDGTAATASTASDSVTFRASGGYRLFTGSGSGGATLAANATSWTTLSDRNAKKDFAPVDEEGVLDKLAQVPIEQWHYKWEQGTETMNIGPMAQDFKHAFYPGRDDKGITTLEFDGVELAAIKGLNEKLEDRSQKLERENDELKQQNDSLAARLDELEQTVKTLAEKK